MEDPPWLPPLCKKPTISGLHLPPTKPGLMVPPERKRNARGQYEIGFNAREEGSVVGKVVREEYEAFVERLKARLNTLSAADLADIENPNYKDDIRSVLAQYLGANTAKIAINFVKKPSAWNLFIKENYGRKASEREELEETPGITISALLTFRRVRV